MGTDDKEVDFSTYFLPKSAGGEPVADAPQAFRVKTVDQESRRITAVASSSAVIDRDGEIISIEALRKAMKGYMENPVLLTSHLHRLDDGRSPVVGKVVDYRFTKTDLIITVEFATTALAQEFWILYRDKFMRAFSIGFRGVKSEEQNVNGRRVRVFTEIELYEISVVTVPSNPAALSKAFVGQKRAEREKQRILNNTDTLCALLDRYDEIKYSGETLADAVLDDVVVFKQFSAAEVEILKQFQGEDFSLADDEFCGDLDDFDDDPADDPAGESLAVMGDSGEDYGKYFSK